MELLLEKEDKGYINIESIVDCLHRKVGDCRHCTADYDTTHHPNNFDCSKYSQVTFICFYVNKQVIK